MSPMSGKARMLMRRLPSSAESETPAATANTSTNRPSQVRPPASASTCMTAGERVMDPGDYRVIGTLARVPG